MNEKKVWLTIEFYVVFGCENCLEKYTRKKSLIFQYKNMKSNVGTDLNMEHTKCISKK